jgi:hypothetical protein
MGFGQPHKRLSEAILRPPTREGYGQQAFPMPAQQLPKAPVGVAPTGAGQTSLRGVPQGLYQAPPQPRADVFPANSTYDRLQQAILQGMPTEPPQPLPMPEQPDVTADPAYAQMLQFLEQQQMGGL